MRIIHTEDLPPRPEDMDGARGLHYRGPIDTSSFRINHVEIEPGGISRSHEHRWEQVNFVLEGSGYLCAGGQEARVTRGDLVVVDSDEPHQFRNDGEVGLVLLGILGPESME